MVIAKLNECGLSQVRGHLGLHELLISIKFWFVLQGKRAIKSKHNLMKERPLRCIRIRKKFVVRIDVIT